MCEHTPFCDIQEIGSFPIQPYPWAPELRNKKDQLPRLTASDERQLTNFQTPFSSNKPKQGTLLRAIML